MNTILLHPLKDDPLNTTELIDAVAEANDIPKAKAREVVNSIFASIIEAAKRGEDSRFQVSRLQDVKAGRRNTIGSTTPWHKTCRRGHDCSGMLAPTTNAASPL